MEAKSPVLELRDVRAGYGQLEVLHGVSMAVSPGEFVTLLGANGAGKTTLLRTVAGYIRPSSGSVQVLGSADRRPPHKLARAGLAFIGEDRQLFANLSVEQSLRLVPNGAKRAFEQFPELAALRRRRVGLLSGGEQQMLALGRAMARQPTLLVFDEVSQGLAPVVRERLLSMLAAVAAQGTAVLAVEQSVETALRVAQTATVLRRGEIIDSRPTSGWAGAHDELVDRFLS
jgi:branched-chain amino acid transport system ATP-binding protein